MQEFFSKCETVNTISTTARLLGNSVCTLRIYEREGQIIPFKKTYGCKISSKLFSELIQSFKNLICDLKVSMNGIKEIYSLNPCSNSKELINKMKREN